MLESHEGRRGGEGLGGRDFDVTGGVGSGCCWGVWSFCGDADISSAVGGND